MNKIRHYQQQSHIVVSHIFALTQLHLLEQPFNVHFEYMQQLGGQLSFLPLSSRIPPKEKEVFIYMYLLSRQFQLKAKVTLYQVNSQSCPIRITSSLFRKMTAPIDSASLSWWETVRFLVSTWSPPASHHCPDFVPSPSVFFLETFSL